MELFSNLEYFIWFPTILNNLKTNIFARFKFMEKDSENKIYFAFFWEITLIYWMTLT